MQKSCRQQDCLRRKVEAAQQALTQPLALTALMASKKIPGHQNQVLLLDQPQPGRQAAAAALCQRR